MNDNDAMIEAAQEQLMRARVSEHDDPCGEAMKPHMERMLRELVADGQAHKEWFRLVAIERAAREVVAPWADADINDLRPDLAKLRKALEGGPTRE